jgi:hypothetical protein
MALDLFNDMNVQMGGKTSRRRKVTKKGKRVIKVRKVRKGTRGKKRRGGSIANLLVPAILTGLSLVLPVSPNHKRHTKSKRNNKN